MPRHKSKLLGWALRHLPGSLTTMELTPDITKAVYAASFGSTAPTRRSCCQISTGQTMAYWRACMMRPSPAEYVSGLIHRRPGQKQATYASSGRPLAR